MIGFLVLLIGVLLVMAIATRRMRGGDVRRQDDFNQPWW